eukprot:7460646-Pyramimonas_sp.AAC.1
MGAVSPCERSHWGLSVEVPTMPQNVCGVCRNSRGGAMPSHWGLRWSCPWRHEACGVRVC